jgi:ParB family transcriptional regulator, chromosome partitioning protein
MVDRKLGRGLDFFLSSGNKSAAPRAQAPAETRAVPAVPVQPVEAPALATPANQLIMVEVGQLAANPHQPRTGIDGSDLTELTQSIRESGVLQPILARRVGQSLQIVAGERRWRAAKLAGLAQVPVVVRETTDQESAVFALVENLQREDLNPLEKARAFRSLQEQLGAKQEEVAQRVGLDRSTVANFMRLLDLAPAVQEHVSRGTLTMGHARALLGSKDPEVQTRLADEAVRQSLSVRALEELVRQANVGPVLVAKKKDPKQIKAAWLKEIEENLTEALSTPVNVRYGRKSSVIQITCGGREEFERIYSKLKDL